MNEQQVHLVQTSFEPLVPQASAVAELFYGRLFALDPSLRPLFPTEMSEQRHKLMTVLSVAVNGLSRIETIVPTLKNLGARHIGYGVVAAHYETVGAALLATLRDGLGEAFTPEVEAAWTQAYTLIAETMQSGTPELAA